MTAQAIIMDSKLPKTVATDLVPGLLATATLGATFFALNLPALVATGIAVAVYGGSRLLLSATTSREATDAEIARDVVERGRASLRNLNVVATGIDKKEVQSAIAGICASGEKIFAIFESDPEKVRYARGFVEFTLQRTLKIATGYRDLVRSGLPSAAPTLERAEKLLATIDGSLHAQIERLMQEDVADLDSEIEVLSTRLEIEGDEGG
jgi:5-bromo-4-chloroindolyl phosphate hydrolysis protein